MKLAKAKGSVRPENGSKVDEINEKNDIEWGYLEELGSLPDMPDELIPENHGFKTYVDRISEAYSCQKCIPATVLLLSLCGVVGSRAGFRPYNNDVTIFYPNTWGGVVAPSGSSKSPIIRASLSPLHNLNNEVTIKRVNELKMRGGEIPLVENKLKKAIKEGEPSKVIAEIQSKLSFLTKDKGKYVVINDTTVEALTRLMGSNLGGLILENDELAQAFVKLEKSGQQGSREFYLECSEGGRPYAISRVGNGDTFIESVTLSIIGGIQPAKLSKYVSDALNPCSYNNDGLLQRLQMVVIPSQCQFKAVDVKTDVPESLNNFFSSLYEVLEQGTMASGSYKPNIYGAELDAVQYWLDWQNSWMAMVACESEQHLVGHFSKYRGLMAGLSLIFCLLNRRGKVAIEDMQLAAGWCEYLSIHARKMYRCSEQGTPTEKLADKIKSGKVKDGITVRLLKSNNILGRGTSKVIDKAVDELVAANWVRIEVVGRGSKILRINPSIKIKGGQS